MNWQQMIVDLQEYGYTQQQLADEIGCSIWHIRDLKSGRRCKIRELQYSVGVKILSLWKKAERKKAQ